MTREGEGEKTGERNREGKGEGKERRYGRGGGSERREGREGGEISPPRSFLKVGAYGHHCIIVQRPQLVGELSFTSKGLPVNNQLIGLLLPTDDFTQLPTGLFMHCSCRKRFS